MEKWRRQIMEYNLEISNFSLLLSTLLLFIAIFVDYKEQLGLGKDILIAGIRSVVQLFIIGYVLGFVFQIDHDLLTLVMVLFIIFNEIGRASCRKRQMYTRMCD